MLICTIEILNIIIIIIIIIMRLSNEKELSAVRRMTMLWSLLNTTTWEIQSCNAICLFSLSFLAL